MNFDMNTTWSQAITLVRSNFQLLAIVAGVFLLLPSMLMYVAIPDIASLMAVADDPEALTTMMEGIIVPIFTYGIIAFIAQIVGYVAMISLMSDDRPTVGQAIMTGIKAIPTLFAALVLFMVLYFVAALIFTILVGLFGVVLGEMLGAILSVVMVLALIAGTLYVMTRLCLTIPIIVLEKQFNPIKDFSRSWKLTGPKSKAIFGFFALLFIGYMVFSILVMGLLGVLIGIISSGIGGAALLLGFANGIVGAGLGMIISGILVSIYRQLSGNDGISVSKAFD